MRDPLTNLPASQPDHVERVGQRMRDETELDGLKDDIRSLPDGSKMTMPWRTGRPLRSGGMNPETGMPITPLAALDLASMIPASVQDKLARDLERAVVIDKVAEGQLDHAEALGIPLTEEELWHEAEVRRDKELGLEGAQQQEDCGANNSSS